MTRQMIDLYTIAKRNNMSVDDVKEIIARIEKGMQPHVQRISVTEHGHHRSFVVERRGLGVLQTLYGKFWHYDFSIDDCWQQYSVLVHAGINTDLQPVFKQPHQLTLRIDSGCMTGQLFGDVTCECKEQLFLALQTIAEVGEGLLINIPHQDGRGMGLPFKLATLWLQDQLNLDTVEAATFLANSEHIDVRSYAGAVCILQFLGINTTTNLYLATNNPKKSHVFTENGYTVDDYVSVVIPPTQHTRHHLQAKQDHLGHHNLIHERNP